MNAQELANHFERNWLVKPEQIDDDWEKGWNAAVRALIRIMREQDV